MNSLDKDIVALMTKRVYDIAGCNPSLKVKFQSTPENPHTNTFSLDKLKRLTIENYKFPKILRIISER